MVSNKTAQHATGPSGHRAADRLLFRVGRQAGRAAGVLAVTSLVIAAARTLLPAVLGRVVDAVVGEGGSSSWLIWAGVLVAIVVACDAIGYLASGSATARSTAWLRHSLLQHVLALGTRATERFPPGDVASRLVGNAGQVGRVAPDIVLGTAGLLPAVGGIVALALIDPWLCLTFLVGAPVLVLMMRAFTRDASHLASRYLEVQGIIATRLVEALSGARTIAAAGTVDRESRRVLAPLPELHRQGMGIWRAQRRLTTQEALLLPLLEVAVLAVAGAELARDRITPGEMLAASQYVLLATGLSSAVAFVTWLARARGAAGRAAEVLHEPPVPYGTARLPAGRGRLEFRGITARAGGQPVLEGLDLGVPAGALVAVVGRSGAGKSLLVALAGRLVDPEEGQVLLDGVPLPRLSRHELRRAVGYGFERPMLIGETVADAIAFGGDTPPYDKVVAAARAARAHDFIRRMPRGYETRLADAPMSGGEAQRVGLARTFAHAGRVVLLDDVAASLDTVTEHHISQVLTGELSDRTRIVVAHRASTAARVDLVVWLDRGRVRAMAPHRELWADPEYRALFGPDGHSPAGADGRSPATVDGAGVPEA